MITLVYAGNDLMMDGILTSLLSIQVKTPQPLDVYVLTGDFTELDPRYKVFREDHGAFIEKCIQFLNRESRLTVVNLGDMAKAEIMKGKNSNGRFSPYTLLRLYLTETEVIKADRVLYLDADIMALSDISPIYEYDLQGNLLGMVKDDTGSLWLSRDYCNAGVILIELGKIKETNMFRLCREMIMKRKLWMPDQSAINTYFEGKISFLPRQCNEQRKTREETILRHFCDVMHLFPYLHVTKVKQWEVDKVHNVLKDHAFDDVLNLLEPLREAFKNGDDPDGVLLVGKEALGKSK